MKNPLISVIIPIYNAENYLDETIQSVLKQTYEVFELLLINHNSTDKSVSIIEEYQQQDKRIKVVNLNMNKGGPAYPRNEGLKIAKGEYIAFLDSDDVWLPEKLEKQLAFLQNNHADVVHTLAYEIDEKSELQGNFDNQKLVNFLKTVISMKNIIYYINYINLNSVLLKKSALVNFEEEKNLIAVEDWQLWIKLIRNEKKIVLLKEKLLNYRVHNASISNRETDIGYRKALYLLSLIFLKKEIPMRHYVFSSLLQICKIIFKRYSYA
ncbi:glycosyltransferase family 2 protein [Sulfurimonas sp. NWX367]|uniref:glycosyltransferase family 2 protein n=1 Tax=Sulfurimonas sp. NWX367 TaxID=2925413 RepID=UPI003204DAAD